MDPVLAYLGELRADLRNDISDLRRDQVEAERRTTLARSESDARHESAIRQLRDDTDNRMKVVEGDVRVLMAFRWKLIGACVGMPVLTGLVTGLVLWAIGGK